MVVVEQVKKKINQAGPIEKQNYMAIFKKSEDIISVGEKFTEIECKICKSTQVHAVIKEDGTMIADDDFMIGYCRECAQMFVIKKEKK